MAGERVTLELRRLPVLNFIPPIPVITETGCIRFNELVSCQSEAAKCVDVMGASSVGTMLHSFFDWSKKEQPNLLEVASSTEQVIIVEIGYLLILIRWGLFPGITLHRGSRSSCRRYCKTTCCGPMLR
ncbi:hypothetical protein R1flu_017836 [Riccia fluitans]|uniref:Uncharacterized protein n=1 Tax=Riccia fluitans TaxID=41844 RepID=A0ABD1ZE64_9MARC